ncbi:unnamed protein product, partial [Mesorhabditis belari]|uniref:S-formylglutathione hydrolase n=1 Tax=Mesorhabditis belari TaxID=2138241 RepID=A0AAF3F1Z7_9BILA
MTHTSEIEQVSVSRSFNGQQKVFKHRSNVLGCEMNFGVYVPDSVHIGKRPALLYLSGLTCTHANFIEKAGAQRFAAQYGFIIINPDTSPRGDNVPDKEDYDFGKGAGFYLDATEEPWAANYKMYSYITKELIDIVKRNFPIDPENFGIFGHSMGGHGAINIGLKHPEIFKSISAFAPACHPTNSNWGRKALSGYLGPDETKWAQYDSSLLAAKYSGPKRIILIDIGDDDSFLKSGELQPESLKSNNHLEIVYRSRAHYDHSYYFVASFMEEHFEHHAKEFQAQKLAKH